MKHAHAIALTTLVLATALLILPTGADAANIRRHLKCAPIQIPSVGLFAPAPVVWSLIITNTWSLTIPKGTTYTVTVDRRSSTFKSGSALGPGQSTGYGNYGSKPQSCNVSVPG
jgi:hypothetical protein